MAYEILVLDIDGTLTNSKKEISPKTLDAILAIQKRGHIVVLASGRPTPGILNLANELKLSEYDGYILSFNGGKIINCKTNEIIYQKLLSKDLIPMLYQDAIDHNVGIMSYENDCIIAGTPMDTYMEIESKINHMPLKVVDNFIEYINFDVTKCIMTADGTTLAAIEPILREKYKNTLNIFRSEPYFLEIMPKNIDKAYSLGKLLEHLGLSKDQMISCGDGYNDLTMIEYAGLGVAMANARDVVKQAANYITLSNDNDGIAHVIQEFML